MGEKDYLKYLDRNATARVRMRIVAVRGQVLQFVVQLEILVQDTWREVVRYDNAHGYAHRDQIDARGNAMKTRLPAVDAPAALGVAVDDIENRWEWYRDRFLESERSRRRR
jgi:hypothetical protein